MASKGYEIPLTVPGITETLRAFDAVAEKIRETGRISRETQNQQRSSRGNVFDRSEHLNSFNGPFASANDERWHNVQRIRAQRSADRADRDLNPSKADPMKTMFMRTRLKIGPWQPLVGDLVKNGMLDEGKIDAMMARIGGSKGALTAVARLASAAMPVVIGAAAVIGVGAAAYGLANAGADSSRRIGSAFYSAGAISPAYD